MWEIMGIKEKERGNGHAVHAVVPPVRCVESRKVSLRQAASVSGE
jgi:hypothetical protein